MQNVTHRVLILNSTYPVGGAERILQQIALGLRSRFEIHVCALYQPGVIGEQMTQQGVPVHALYGASRTDLRVLPRFVRLLRQIRPHVLFTVDSPHAVVYAVIAKRLHLVPRLVIAVRSFGKLQRAREMAIARRLASPVTDVLIALSEKHLRFLITQEGWKARQAIIIPNGVDLYRFSPAGHHFREAWGIDEEAISFGIVAALRPEKNHFRFLRVADQVLSALSNARAFIVGDGEMRETLLAFHQQLRHSERIVFTGLQHDTPAVWRTLDVAVLTSDREVLPVSLIEAAACGVPAVSTDVGVVRDIIVDGQTGFVVSVEHEGLLAERILYLLQNADERRRMGEHARRHAEAHFNLQTMIERYARVLHPQQIGEIQL